MSHSIGFIGLGVLGNAIARLIAESGARLVGHDISDAACAAAVADGVPLAADLAELAAQSDIVFTCMPNGAALHAVCAELARVERPGQLVVDLTTASIADKETARDILADAGRRVLDCPVSGNRIMALEKKLTAFCSGEREDYETVRDTLLTFCRKEHYVGAFGNGSKTKFCGNILNLIHNIAAAEAMVLAIKSGLDPKVFHEVISGSGSSSAMFEVRGKLMAENDYAREGMNFSVPLKDSRIIADHAASVGMPIPLYQAGVQFYHAAVAQGLAHLDAAAVCRVMERNANCERPT